MLRRSARSVQNKFAFARAHIADTRCPLRMAMHADASSVSAASSNDVGCRFGSRKAKRGILIVGFCRSGCSGA
eukprot:5826261-Pleurochrysis_carterae.AAC.1